MEWCCRIIFAFLGFVIGVILSYETLLADPTYPIPCLPAEERDPLNPDLSKHPELQGRPVWVC